MLRTSVFLLAAFCAGAASMMAGEFPVTGGSVRGETLADGSAVFRGIPYAAPPVGPLRWKPPQPVVTWSGIRDTTKAASPCIQHDEGWNADLAAIGREDCLYVSVHAPRHAPGERLPVMVWIHGGSNWAGSSYGYVDSAIHSRGVVLVSIEYRLGVFGFLASPALSVESPDGTSGNLGLRDQIAALEWVKQNIAAFGGDPDNVTIFGQSAGAFDVWMLMLSPKARGLFHKAILQSAVIGLPVRSQTDNERIGLELAKLMGVPDDAEGLRALRAAAADKLIETGNKLAPTSGVHPSMMWYQPMIDGWVLPRAPAEILASGEQANVPLILGDVTREFPPDGSADLAREMIKSYFKDKEQVALKSYGLDGNAIPPDDPLLGSVAAQVGADAVIRCPSNRMARAHAAAGYPTWRYQFGVAAPGSNKPPEHNADLAYVFDAAPESATFASRPPVQQYWTNFARTGNPNGPGLPEWPQFGSDAGYLGFTPQGVVPGKDLRGGVCRALDSE